ncbi:MAG TPA: DEAD/DEAH box helicase [Chthoniobacterales bacterium]
MPFRSLGLAPRVLQAVQEAGYTEPTPIQAAAIPAILTGRDLIGIAQTGTGKTAAFTLPVLTKLASQITDWTTQRTLALILAPTRELAVQIEENVKAYAHHLPLRVATVFGGVGERPQIQALKSGAHVVIACPGRLLDLMQQRHGDFSKLEHLVLDEADRMLDMGFIPSIRDIVRRLPKKRQTLLFSATLSKEIESLTHEFQHDPQIVQIGRRSNPAETVSQFVYEVPQSLKLSLLGHLLGDPGMDSVLVFTRTKHGADRVARRLEGQGIRTGTLHSNRSQAQRLRALNDFKAGTVRVLVATDIAARGIDVDGISHVINYDFPMHAEDYVHRIGRTGRARAVGEAISFVAQDDHAPLKTLERFIGRGIVRKRANNFDYNAPASTVPVDKRPTRPNSGPRRPGPATNNNGKSVRDGGKKPVAGKVAHAFRRRRVR